MAKERIILTFMMGVASPPSMRHTMLKFRIALPEAGQPQGRMLFACDGSYFRLIQGNAHDYTPFITYLVSFRNHSWNNDYSAFCG